MADVYLSDPRNDGLKAPAVECGGGDYFPIQKVKTFDGNQVDTDIIRIATLPSGAHITKGVFGNEAIVGMTDVDFGIYKAGIGGAAIDADLFLDGADLSSASTGMDGDALASLPIDKVGRPLYEMLGLTADPMVDYDLALTLNTAGSASGVSANFIVDVSKQG